MRAPTMLGGRRIVDLQIKTISASTTFSLAANASAMVTDKGVSLSDLVMDGYERLIWWGRVSGSANVVSAAPMSNNAWVVNTSDTSKTGLTAMLVGLFAKIE